MQLDKYFPLKHHEGDIGIELEVEATRHLPQIMDKMWTTKGENSLRGYANEYVSHGPMWNNPEKYIHIRKVTDKLYEYPVLKDSPRTSVHVHVNVQKYKIEQVYAVMCAYWLVENILVKFCGEAHREGNHFCLRLCDAEGIIKFLTTDIRNNCHFSSVMGNKMLRYGALNVCAVPTFGSLEFRAMRGTLDPEIIDLWSSELQHLCAKIRKKFPNPAEFMDYYFVSDKQEFLSRVFSKNFTKILLETNHWRELMEENEGPLCELAYSRDWKVPIEIKVKPPRKKRKMRVLDPARYPAIAPAVLRQIEEQAGWIAPPDPIMNEDDWQLLEMQHNMENGE